MAGDMPGDAAQHRAAEAPDGLGRRRGHDHRAGENRACHENTPHHRSSCIACRNGSMHPAAPRVNPAGPHVPKNRGRSTCKNAGGG